MHRIYGADMQEGIWIDYYFKHVCTRDSLREIKKNRNQYYY